MLQYILDMIVLTSIFTFIIGIICIYYSIKYRNLSGEMFPKNKCWMVQLVVGVQLTLMSILYYGTWLILNT